MKYIQKILYTTISHCHVCVCVCGLCSFLAVCNKYGFKAELQFGMENLLLAINFTLRYNRYIIRIRTSSSFCKRHNYRFFSFLVVNK